MRNEYAEKRFKINMPEMSQDNYEKWRKIAIEYKSQGLKNRRLNKQIRRMYIALLTDMDYDFWKTGWDFEQDKVTHVLHRRIYKAFPVSGISKKFVKSYKSQLFHERCLLRLRLSQLKFSIFYYGPKPNND